MYKCDQMVQWWTNENLVRCMWPLETFQFNNLSFLLFSDFFFLSLSIPQSIALCITLQSIILALFLKSAITSLLWHLILSIELSILLFPLLQNQREQNYTVLKTRSNMMTVDGLKPGTTYVFRVRARTDGGYGSYGGEIELETSHEGKGMNDKYFFNHSEWVILVFL